MFRGGRGSRIQVSGKTEAKEVPEMTRTVTANISLSLDGRVNGAGVDYDMSWIVPHAITESARRELFG